MVYIDVPRMNGDGSRETAEAVMNATERYLKAERKSDNQTTQRYNFSPEYNYEHYGLSEDLRFVSVTLYNICQQIDRDTARVSLSAQAEIPWAVDAMKLLNGESELICDAYALINDTDDYLSPGSLQAAKDKLTELYKYTLSEQMRQFARLYKGKPYALELMKKASAIGQAVSTAQYYVSKILMHFKKEEQL